MKALKEILLIGAGNRCKILLELLSQSSISVVVHILDTDSDKWGTQVNNYIIEPISDAYKYNDILFCITPASFVVLETIRKEIVGKYHMDLCQEVTYQWLIMKLYNHIDLQFDIEARKNDNVSLIFDCEYGLGLGGIEEWTKGICKEFVKHQEFPSYILCNDDINLISNELKNHIVHVDIQREKAFSVENVKEVIHKIAKYLPCIIVTSQPDDILLCGKLLREKYGEDVKIVSGIRGGHPEIFQRYIDMRLCTDLYVCVNSNIRKNMIALGVHKNDIYTMLCPVECPDKNNRTYSMIGQPIRIGYAGRIQVDEKRADLIEKLCSELEENQINYIFELAGEGSYENEMFHFIENNKLKEKVKLIGKIDKMQIPAFWQTKDICINISDHEGRSRTTIEAMANGVVPIVTETSGVYDDIEDGVNGFIVALQDYKTMAKRIKYLEKNRYLLKYMGEKAHLELKGKSNMEEHYSFWKMIISKLCE